MFIKQNQGTLNIAGHKVKVYIEVNSGKVNLSGFDNHVYIEHHFRSAEYNTLAFGNTQLHLPEEQLMDEGANLLIINNDGSSTIAMALSPS